MNIAVNAADLAKMLTCPRTNMTSNILLADFHKQLADKNEQIARLEAELKETQDIQEAQEWEQCRKNIPTVN